MGHKCGKCGVYGHGMLECEDYMKIEKLKNENGEDKIPDFLRCKKPGCQFRELHMDNGHFCSKCGDNHSLQECKITDIEDELSPYHDRYKDENALKILKSQTGKVCVKIYRGMGCWEFVRNNNDTGIYDNLHMHSDDWGQYGKGRVYEFNKFIEGYELLN